MRRAGLGVLVGALCAVSVISTCAALDNGLGLKPALGFNTWNAYGRFFNETQVKYNADLMVSLGLRDVGYTYLVLDDGWMDHNRTKDGKLVGDLNNFPSGMKAVGEYIHSRGLQFGIYEDAGTTTCSRYPGSYGYEDVDAQTFAEWDVDYLKYDNCHASRRLWVLDRFQAMRDALNRTGRPIVYSLCQWGIMDPHLWAPEDIRPYWNSILKTLDYNVGLSRFAGPRIGFNDLDMLYVGNDTGLTINEQRAHFALWALYKSPLMIGHDLRDMSDQALAILKSKEVIAINQDGLGVAGDLVWRQGNKRVYAGPLAGGGRAVILANFQTPSSQYPVTNITVFWHQIGLQPGQRCSVRDLYAERELGTAAGSFWALVGARDVAVLRITPLEAPWDESWRPWHGQPMYEAQQLNVGVLEKELWVGKGAPWRHVLELTPEQQQLMMQQDEEDAVAAAVAAGGSGGSDGSRRRWRHT